METEGTSVRDVSFVLSGIMIYLCSAYNESEEAMYDV